MDLLTEILKPARATAIVDIGANPIDGEPPYKAMLAAGLDGIDHQIDPHDLVLESVVVVDDLVGAEPLHELDVFGRRGGDHVGAELLRDLG